MAFLFSSSKSQARWRRCLKYPTYVLRKKYGITCPRRTCKWLLEKSCKYLVQVALFTFLISPTEIGMIPCGSKLNKGLCLQTECYKSLPSLHMVELFEKPVYSFSETIQKSRSDLWCNNPQDEWIYIWKSLWHIRQNSLLNRPMGQYLKKNQTVINNSQWCS